MSKVVILGAGKYGTALGGLVAENGYDVDYYDPEREDERLKDVVKGAKYIVLCTPSEVAPRILPHLPKKIPLVVATKGFLTTKYFDGFKKWEVLSGPGFAEDIKAGREVHLTATKEWVGDLFDANFMFFDYVEDKKAVLMCGALKNVYAMLAGKMRIKPHSSAMREYIEDASYEMGLIIRANGANRMAIYFACGIGDLILTCTPASRNYTFGKRLRKNPKAKPQETVEGMTTLRRIAKGEITIPEEAQFLRQLIADSEAWV